VWVVDEEFKMRRLIRRGIDGIFTNRPDVLSRVIHEEIGKA
jgi:glycerophosphoryl diester phosphodiesterase